MFLWWDLPVALGSSANATVGKPSGSLRRPVTHAERGTRPAVTGLSGARSQAGAGPDTAARVPKNKGRGPPRRTRGTAAGPRPPPATRARSPARGLRGTRMLPGSGREEPAARTPEGAGVLHGAGHGEWPLRPTAESKVELVIPWSRGSATGSASRSSRPRACQDATRVSGFLVRTRPPAGPRHGGLEAPVGQAVKSGATLKTPSFRGGGEGGSAARPVPGRQRSPASSARPSAPSLNSLRPRERRAGARMFVRARISLSLSYFRWQIETFIKTGISQKFDGPLG